jgi:hypothetical protein
VGDLLHFDDMRLPADCKLTQNTLRLILTWCGEGNILRAKLPRLESKADLTTAYIAPSASLSADQVASLFPETGVYFKFENCSKKIYDSHMMLSGQETPLDHMTK